MLSMKCPTCGAGMKVRENQVGKPFSCPRCEGVITLPPVRRPGEAEPPLLRPLPTGRPPRRR
jgi:DNA-directed RNA polymerase subunit RPC12/RpoP